MVNTLLIQLTFDTKIGRFFRTREILSDKRDYSKIAHLLMEKVEGRVYKSTSFSITLCFFLLFGIVGTLALSLLVSPVFFALVVIFLGAFGYKIAHFEDNEFILRSICKRWDARLKKSGIRYDLQTKPESKIELSFYRYRSDSGADGDCLSLSTIIDEAEFEQFSPVVEVPHHNNRIIYADAQN